MENLEENGNDAILRLWTKAIPLTSISKRGGGKIFSLVFLAEKEYKG